VDEDSPDYGVDQQLRGVGGCGGNHARDNGRGEKRQGLGDDFSDAARYYSGKANSGISSVGDAFDRAKSAFTDAFRGRDEPPAAPSDTTQPT
jgi:hypothetical protein